MSEDVETSPYTLKAGPKKRLYEEILCHIQNLIVNPPRQYNRHLITTFLDCISQKV